MRLIRTVLLLIFAVVLVILALANRQPVTLSLKFTEYLPGGSVTLPLFLVLIVTLAIGVTAGLIWEWLRAAPARAQSARREHQIKVLEREVRALRKNHAGPSDEVLAILDAPKKPRKTPGTAASRPPAALLAKG